MPAPSLLTPAQGSMVNGLTTLRWLGSTTAERYSIRINRDENGGTSTVTDEVLWRSQVSCAKRTDGLSCDRTYGLPDGNYTGVFRASCGGDWGPPTTAGFTVNSSAVPVPYMSPPIWSPSKGATTSIQPVMMWSRVAAIDAYSSWSRTRAGFAAGMP